MRGSAVFMLHPLERLPWAGAGERYAIMSSQEVRKQNNSHFHNTRAQAEIHAMHG